MRGLLLTSILVAGCGAGSDNPDSATDSGASSETNTTGSNGEACPGTDSPYWTRSFDDGGGFMYISALALTSGGDIVGAGNSRETVDFCRGRGPTPDQIDDHFLVTRIDHTGAVLWGQIFGVDGDHMASGVGP